MFARHGRDRTYARSQAETSLRLVPGPVPRGLVFRLLNSPEDAASRGRLGQMLLDTLCDEAGMPRCELVVADRAQVHAHDGRRVQSRTYGYYRCWFDDRGRVGRSRIRIYHRTAVRQQVIAPKVFVNTLLHEWVHHYDFTLLGLSRSLHTSGFFSRLRHLASELQVGFVLPPEPDVAAAPAASGRG